MRADRELLKGSTPVLILAVLAEGPRHGYAIAREIEQRSNGVLSLGEGSLYPALHGLEREGFIVGGWEVVAGGGPPRKVYALAESGQTALRERTALWRNFVGAIEGVIAPTSDAEGGLPDVPLKPRPA